MASLVSAAAFPTIMLEEMRTEAAKTEYRIWDGIRKSFQAPKYLYRMMKLKLRISSFGQDLKNNEKLAMT